MTYCWVRLEKGAPLRTTIPLSTPCIHPIFSRACSSASVSGRSVCRVGVTSCQYETPSISMGMEFGLSISPPMMLEFVNNVENTRMLESHPNGEDTDRTGICPSLQYYYAHPSVLLVCPAWHGTRRNLSRDSAVPYQKRVAVTR